MYCDDRFCSRVADWFVKDENGAVMGKFCITHSSEFIAEYDRAEKAAHAKNGSE